MIMLEWRSASNPSGNCVEAAALPGAQWETASANSNSCVEITRLGVFHTASVSGGACVEVARALAWAVPCANGECVEVAPQGPVIGVRDSKNHSMGVLGFSRGQWEQVLADPQGAFRMVAGAQTPVGCKDGQETLFALDCPCGGNTLFFTGAEVARFGEGVAQGMFVLAGAQ